MDTAGWGILVMSGRSWQIHLLMLMVHRCAGINLGQGSGGGEETGNYGSMEGKLKEHSFSREN